MSDSSGLHCLFDDGNTISYRLLQLLPVILAALLLGCAMRWCVARQDAFEDAFDACWRE